MADYQITYSEINKMINSLLTRKAIIDCIKSVSFHVLYLNGLATYCNSGDEGAIEVFAPFTRDPAKVMTPLIVAVKRLIYDEIKKLDMHVVIDAATTYRFTMAVLVRLKTALPEYNWDEANIPEDLIGLKYDLGTKTYFKNRRYYPVLTVSTKGSE